MTERGYRVKSDANKKGWEESDFPILCETCLGENPYLRMMKEPAGKACKICERPFTIFRWRPGPRARFKKTEVCQMCAKLKNVCQTCVLDLTYGLPVQVRDAFLAKASASSLTKLSVPESDVGRAYQAQQHQAMLANGTPHEDDAIHQGLLRLARRQPNYRRNLPHICSFYARGECNRGSECPYRHEIPKPRDDPFAKQNIQDRFHGRNDPVAQAMLKRTAGKAQYGAPPDGNVKTLWLAPIPPGTTQNEIKDHFYSFGEIQSIKIISEKKCAFVEYSTQAQAVEACKGLYASLKVGGESVRVAWAHPPKRGPRLLGDNAPRGAAPSAAAAPVSSGAATGTSGAPATASSGSGSGSGSGSPAAAQAPGAPAGSAPKAGATFQFPAYLASMPPPPGLRPGMKIPPPPKGMPAYTGVVPPPPPRRGSGSGGRGSGSGGRGGGRGGGPVRHGRTPHAAMAAHPYYASMDPRAMGSRVNLT